MTEKAVLRVFDALGYVAFSGLFVFSGIRLGWRVAFAVLGIALWATAPILIDIFRLVRQARREARRKA